jgi:hypothetical protein
LSSLLELHVSPWPRFYSRVDFVLARARRRPEFLSGLLDFQIFHYLRFLSVARVLVFQWPVSFSHRLLSFNISTRLRFGFPARGQGPRLGSRSILDSCPLFLRALVCRPLEDFLFAPWISCPHTVSITGPALAKSRALESVLAAGPIQRLPPRSRPEASGQGFSRSVLQESIFWPPSLPQVSISTVNLGSAAHVWLQFLIFPASRWRLVWLVFLSRSGAARLALLRVSIFCFGFANRKYS